MLMVKQSFARFSSKFYEIVQIYANLGKRHKFGFALCVMVNIQNSNFECAVKKVD